MNKSKNIYAVILAGGSGTRFWPISRQAKPKQFLALSNTDESLIQATARRINALIDSDVKNRLLIVTNKELSSQAKEHVPQSHIVSEPFGRNTAASIGLAALEIFSKDPDGVMIVLPADHSVANEEVLRQVLLEAVEAAQTYNALVTIGIKPESANTAYGYIQRGQKKTSHCFEVARFFEKPNLERAMEYCATGNFYWNSGMFVWKASAILNAFSEHMPKLSEALLRIEKNFGTEKYNESIEVEFNNLESISIDFGVLEHAHNCMVVEAAAFGWNDVGSWDAWAQHYKPDEVGNVCSGEVLQVQSKNCIALAAKDSKRIVGLLGVENLVVVDTPDALLICDRSKVQDVKLVVDALRKQGRTDLL